MAVVRIGNSINMGQFFPGENVFYHKAATFYNVIN